ncbi:MAG: rod shape-determining protein [Defluviitaleaceae bacterium]|nr:rod shape-determining protein [Defluviitaleaceae bacterium]
MEFADFRPPVVTFYNGKRQVLVKEIALLAILEETKGIIALGEEVIGVKSKIESADNTFIRKFGNVLIVSPLENGTVANLDLAKSMFKYLFLKAKLKRFFKFLRPHVAICIPVKLTRVDRAAFANLVHGAGARSDVLVVETSCDEAIINQIIPNKYEIIIEILP